MKIPKGFFCAWIGKDNPPKGWRKLTKKETEDLLRNGVNNDCFFGKDGIKLVQKLPDPKKANDKPEVDLSNEVKKGNL